MVGTQKNVIRFDFWIWPVFGYPSSSSSLYIWNLWLAGKPIYQVTIDPWFQIYRKVMVYYFHPSLLRLHDFYETKKMSMKFHAQIRRLLFASQIRGSLSNLRRKPKVLKRRGQNRDVTWTMKSWLVNDGIHTMGLVCLPMYTYHKNRLNVQTTPKTEEMWTSLWRYFHWRFHSKIWTTPILFVSHISTHYFFPVMSHKVFVFSVYPP